MGSFSNTVSRYWSKEEIEFLRAHSFMRGTELAALMKRGRGINDKMRALGFPRRECDTVPLTDFQKQLIYGSLLGDGSIGRGVKDKNYRFSESHSLKQREYLLFKYEQLKPYSGKFIEYPTKWGGEVKFSTHNHEEFTKIRPLFYSKNGKKMIKASTLRLINHPIALAVWIGDDGSKEKDSIRIATASYTVKELRLLINWLEDYFRITAYFHKHGQYWYLSIRREDRFVLSDLVRDFLPRSMHYKLFLS